MLKFVSDPEPDRLPTDEYVCYMLVSSVNPRRTYVGCTNNMKRRIRQHNGEIKGGARYTTKFRPWVVKFMVFGFGSSRSMACKFETHWKRSSHRFRHKTSIYDKKMPSELVLQLDQCMCYLAVTDPKWKNRVYGIVASSFYLELPFCS